MVLEEFDTETSKIPKVEDYQLPDSSKKEDWAKCVVLIYKTLKGVPYYDRAWDRIHWPRTAKAAKILLDIVGGVRQADACMVELAENFDERELNWTLETIVKHAHDWIAKKRGARFGNPHRAGLLTALTEKRQRSASGTGTGEGTREISGPEGSGLPPEPGNQSNGNGT